MTDETPLRVRSAAEERVTDQELEQLLQEVFVGGAFTDPKQAAAVFAAGAVRELGEILVVRDSGTKRLAGMVVVLSPSSPARRIAAPNEAEMRLLAISRQHRGSGVGKALVEAAMETARAAGHLRIVLWTQGNTAQQLYTDAGFSRAPGRDWQQNNRQFLVYEARL